MPLTGRHVLITSGPTQAPIDAVRYIANTSSGALGAHTADAALDAGASVLLVHGPGSIVPQPHPRLTLSPVRTVDDLIATLQRQLAATRFDAIAHAMAVLDYVPEAAGTGKIPSGQDHIDLRLVPTPKVIDRVREWAPDSLLIGFKLVAGESDEGLRQAALTLLRRSGADLVVANDMVQIQAGEHRAVFIEPSGRTAGAFVGKAAIAEALVREIAARLAGREGSGLS
ncbi:MAG TPA: phosphopantothenoylcysteine decarboxylase [Armatimonadota bacterium]|nr:phosphopantothenoylcysteine decarboxylase [Armatimonadota bacterium]